MSVMEKENNIDVIKLDIPLFLRLLEYAKEDAKTDMDLHYVTENIIKLSQNEEVLTMKNYDNIVKKNDKIKIGELKEIIREQINNILNEGKNIQ